MLSRRLSLASLALLVFSPGTADANPVVISQPVASAPDGEGTGLCIASAVSTSPDTDFGNLSPGIYNSALNSFIEGHAADRFETVIRTLLDLSNNNDTGLKLSYGDFTDAVLPACKTGGCDFFINDTSTSFGSRLRGFLNVTPDYAGKPIHVGLYTDDAVSLTFFDKDRKAYPVLTRPPKLGAPTWRLTNTITFEQPGLYPVELLYVEITEHAALEMSMLIDPSFVDYELPANSVGSTSLKAAGYTLFEPTSFFHTLSGVPSFEDLDQCKQCNREFVNVKGNNGCIPGYYCNEAALCAPCDTAVFCGPSCSPCGGDTPFCINGNGQMECGGCRDDFDCEVGFSCDLEKHVCQECTEDSQCVKGEICVDHSCIPCAEPGTCAGNSCNCCPFGSNGKQMQCAPLATDKDGWPVCVECTTNLDCASGICDLVVGHCVDEIQKNESPECCGDSCYNCTSEVVAGKQVVPFCLPGPIGTACAECRSDMDCGDGKYCNSGYCDLCIRDRRCGNRCETCGGDTPYCLGQFPDSAECVRCTSDDQCAGTKCDLQTRKCEPGCSMSCAPDTPHCDGVTCVQCYADTQCPCGGTCDFATNTCSPDCKTNVDCLGNEHCRWDEAVEDKECALGPMPGDVACGGTLADACSASIGKRGGEAPPAGLIGLVLMALLGRRRGRVRGES